MVIIGGVVYDDKDIELLHMLAKAESKRRNSALKTTAEVLTGGVVGGVVGGTIGHFTTIGVTTGAVAGSLGGALATGVKKWLRR